jgi:hypothetical protein
MSPNLANERVDKEDAIVTKSNTESVEPILAIPYTLVLDPRRQKERIEPVLPMLIKSKTLMVVDKFAYPYIERPEANLFTPRRENADPMW